MVMVIFLQKIGNLKYSMSRGLKKQVSTKGGIIEFQTFVGMD